MSDNKITIMPAQMKAIAKYEDTFAAFMGPDGSGITATDAMKEMLDIPEGFNVLNILAIGYNRRLQPDAEEEF